MNKRTGKTLEMEQRISEHEAKGGKVFRATGKPSKVIHKNLGECFVTDICRYMELTNPDKSSMFVEHEGELLEVTKSLIQI